jgi:hypothetical protein
MELIVTGKCAPDVSVEQRTLDWTRKQLRKLRWIGREDDAERMLLVLSEAGLHSPTLDERRNGSSSVDTAKHSIA